MKHILLPGLPHNLSTCLPLAAVLSFSVSATEYAVDASLPTDAGQNRYIALGELLASVTPSEGDTITLLNNDSSLTSGLNVSVNFVSDNLDMPRTVDLAGLTDAALYTLRTGTHTMKMDSVVLTNAQEGVFEITGNKLTLEIDGGHVRFEHNHNNGGIKNHPTNPYAGSMRWSFGGAIYLQGENSALRMKNDVSFAGNFVDATTDLGGGYGAAFGGAIHLDSDTAELAMGNHATFSNNYADGKGNARGGAIYIGAAVDWFPALDAPEPGSKQAFLTLGDHASFQGNYVDGSARYYSDGYSRSYGGAISMEGTDNSHVTANLGTNTVFSGNYATVSGEGLSRGSCMGGAIRMSGGTSSFVELNLGANAVFSGNYVFSNDPSGEQTSSYNYGGAIDMVAYSSLLLRVGENAVFRDNLALTDHPDREHFAMGGAISVRMYSASLPTLWIQDGASFTNNYATSRGGAIYIIGPNSIADSSADSFLGAFVHNVVFRGNMSGGSLTRNGDGSHTVKEGIANAIHVQGSHILRLVADQGREIRFYDPITNEKRDYWAKDPTLILSLNLHERPDGVELPVTNGSIIFSGELYKGEDAHLIASRYNDFKGQTVLHGGTLVLESQVVFGNAELKENTSVTLLGGALEMTGHSVLNAATFTVSSGDVVLRPGSAAFVNAMKADLSHGFVFDMQRQIEEGGNTAAMTGLSVNAAQSFTTGGSIGIQDTGASNYYYADNSWARQRSFNVLTDANMNHEGDFSGVSSLASGTDRIENPFTYTGTWSHEWVDADGDGFAERLRLIWNPDAAPISDILPELAGSLAVNSMWSSVSNIRNVSSAALGNLNALRFTTGPETNYWIRGMGDFTYQGSAGERDGFDYNGGGCTLGADRRIAPHAVLGLAFGEIDGKMYSRSFAGDTGQQTRLGLLYGGWRKELNKRNSLLFSGTCGYGWTDNTMNSFHTGGQSHGEWTNHTLAATLKAVWSRAWSERFSLDVTIGVEYADVTEDAFTESGWDARRFDKGRLKNLSLPIGTGVTHRSTLGGKTWINSASVSYVPDIYRHNPGAPAERLLNGFRWEAEGAAPERNAVRMNVDSMLELDARWKAYADYEFEGRNKATSHRFNAGVSYAY